MPIDATPLALETLPVVVAGPILRRLTATSVSVWLACTEPDPITLTVGHVSGGSGLTTTATVTPTQVGRHLWMAVLTAPAPDGTFAAGEIYAYDLTAPWQASPQPDWSALSLPGDIRRRSWATASLRAISTSTTRRAASRTGAAATRSRWRWRTGHPLRAPRPTQPHLLLMSGDQIYADEVGHPADAAGAARRQPISSASTRRACSARPRRSAAARPGTDALGFTWRAAANHLWTFGEFIAMYLLDWSPVLWPAHAPGVPDDAPCRPTSTRRRPTSRGTTTWLNVQLFRAALPDVRRVLANVPSLMIFDDHEITDDWNLDYAWVNSVYAKPGGRRRGHQRRARLRAVPALGQHAGSPSPRPARPSSSCSTRSAAAAPPRRHEPGHGRRPAARRPRRPAARRAARPGAARPHAPERHPLRRDVGPDEGWPVRIVLLDERTVREYPRADAQAARISLAALAVQLPPPATPVPFTIVVAAAPILGTDLVERRHPATVRARAPGRCRVRRLRVVVGGHAPTTRTSSPGSPPTTRSSCSRATSTTASPPSSPAPRAARPRASPSSRRRRPRTSRPRTRRSACSAS